jgi:hypothetical protein
LGAYQVVKYGPAKIEKESLIHIPHYMFIIFFMCFRVNVSSQSWVLYSTSEYAASIIEKNSLKKPSNEILSKIAEELFQEFKATGLNIPKPIFMKAHRWLVFQCLWQG